MKKTIAFCGFVFLALSACTPDDSLVTEVQKVVEVNLDFNAARSTTNTGELFLTETSDIVAEDFAEYLTQIRDFQVNSLSIRLDAGTPVPGQSQSVAVFDRFDLDLSSLEAGGLRVNMIDLSDFVIGNEVMLYRKDSTSSSDLNNAINFVRSRLLREQAFSWQLSGEVRVPRTDQNFGIKLLLDLSAEVILD